MSKIKGTPASKTPAVQYQVYFWGGALAQVGNKNIPKDSLTVFIKRDAASEEDVRNSTIPRSSREHKGGIHNKKGVGSQGVPSSQKVQGTGALDMGKESVVPLRASGGAIGVASQEDLQKSTISTSSQQQKDGSRNKTSADLPEASSAKRDLNPVVPDGTQESPYSKLFEASGSIKILDAELFIPYGKPLGILEVCIEDQPPCLEDLNPHDVANFHLRYTRQATENYKNRTDDLAVIARAFLLAKIMVFKSEMRMRLEKLSLNLKKVARFKKRKGNSNLARMYATLEHEDQKQEKGDGLLEKWWQVENCLATGINGIMHGLKQKIWAQTVAVVWVFFLVSLLFCGLLNPIGSGHGFSGVWLKWSLGVLGFPVFIAFLGIALNLRTLEDRIEEKMHEDAVDELNNILSSLVQTNANVAALHMDPAPDGCVSELLLRKIDKVLQTKEAVVSLEKVILTRERNISARVMKIKEHQQRARRAVTAAAGGVFTGFFTFEVGESVLKYMHLQHGKDDRSMFYWFATEAGPYSNPDLRNERKVPPVETNHRIEKKCEEAKKKDPTKVCSMELTPDPGQLHEHFKQQYQKPELQAYGVLLTITLLVSLLAAWIGWRKPSEEQAGGGGHHH